MALDLVFHGAAGCVTGSCSELSGPGYRVLVDCGMFQGSKTLKALNYEPFPFDARTLDAVLLTHAHIDHSGLLPKLMKAGFSGPIYTTTSSRDLCRIMLADAGGIQESEVRYLNRRNQRRGRDPVEPIYTEADARRTLDQFRKIRLGDVVKVAPGLEAVWWEAGHILGGGSVEVRAETGEGVARLLFSGDLGPGGRDYMPDPEGPSGVDHLILESTYGNRERERVTPEARRALLASELQGAFEAGGPLLIPAFAVERSQELLADIMTIMDDGQAPEADIFLDSPMATEVTEVFRQRGWNRATRVNPFTSLHGAGRLKFTPHPADSDRLEQLRGWHIIMAASGMCDAGRVRRHLKRLLWNREATVLITGYQAVGTLGRLLVDGARRVKIQGEDFGVRARIRSIEVYSGHADAQGLTEWALARGPVRGSIFLDHGEPPALDALALRLAEAGFDKARIVIPQVDQAYRLTPALAVAQPTPAPRIPPGTAASPDWHNARAQLILDLNERLEGLSPEARDALIQRIGGLLASAQES